MSRTLNSTTLLTECQKTNTHTHTHNKGDIHALAKIRLSAQDFIG